MIPIKNLRMLPNQSLLNTKMRIPLPLLPLYVFAAIGFVIYIPVSFIKSNLPLFVLDALLLASSIMTLFSYARSKNRLLGGSWLVCYFIGMYILSILVGLAVDIEGGAPILSTLQGIRSLVFGIPFIVLSTIWFTNSKRLDWLFNVYVIGALFAALYGLRQFMFGLMPFEIERMSMFGSLGEEMDILDRIRIPSTFGDPVAFAFSMMVGILLLPLTSVRAIVRYRGIAYCLLLAGLAMSLVRGPLVGLAVALFFLFIVRPTLASTKIRQLIIGITIAAVFILSLDYAVSNGLLNASSNKTINAVNGVITSVWSALPYFVDSDALSPGFERLRTSSVQARRAFWQQGLNYLIENPYGAGIGLIVEHAVKGITFSAVDVGILRFGLQLGWLGLVGIVGLWMSTFCLAYSRIDMIQDHQVKRIGLQLLAIWVGCFVTLLGTCYIATAIFAGLVWMIGGILINMDLIANNHKIDH